MQNCTKAPPRLRRNAVVATIPDVTRRGPNLLRVRVYTSHMRNAGIHPGDTVIVDDEREPQNGDIVCVEAHGVRLIRRLVDSAEGALLVAETPQKPTVKPHGMRLVGVVIGVVRRKPFPR
jgi:SOS-response transcriptional repressor LexA